MSSAQVVDLTSDNSPTSTKALPNTSKSSNNSSKPAASTNASTSSTNTTTAAAATNKTKDTSPKQESTTKTPQQTGAETDAEWTESDYTAALTSLDHLHDQINTLRSAIPTMIATFSAPHPSPDSLLSSFESLAKTSTMDMRAVRTSWMSEPVQRILTRAKTRSEELRKQGGGGGILDETQLPLRSAVGDGWEVVDVSPPNGKKSGVQVDVKSLGDDDDDWDMDLDDSGAVDNSREGLARVIEEFREQNPAIGIDVDEESRSMKVTVPVPGRPLEFTILQQSQQSSPNDSKGEERKETTHFSVSCRGSTRLCAAITRSLKVNPFKNDLMYILDLIASYANIQTAKCVVCHTLLDENAMLPVTRKLKATKDVETGVVQKQWVALHDRC